LRICAAAKNSQQMAKERFMRFEQLEDRCFMAADVTAAIQNGNLVIAGGDANDHVSVYQVAGDKFKVLGQDGTLINGATSVTLAGVTNIQIVMGNGNDYVIVRNSHIAGNVSYVMGNGVDDVKIQSCFVDGSVSAQVGQGQSEVYIGLPTATAHGPSYDTQ